MKKLKKSREKKWKGICLGMLILIGGLIFGYNLLFVTPPKPSFKCKRSFDFSEKYLPLQTTIKTQLQSSPSLPSSFTLPPHSPFLISLWASWCDPCIEEMPLLIKWSQKFTIPIYWINVDPERANHPEKLHQIASNLTPYSFPLSPLAQDFLWPIYSFFLPLHHRHYFLTTFELDRGTLPLHLWVFPNRPLKTVSKLNKSALKWKACVFEGSLNQRFSRILGS